MDITEALKSQYHAALEMLRQVVRQCSDELWLDEVDGDPFWQVAYHGRFHGRPMIHRS